jgi:hypothetical protein
MIADFGDCGLSNWIGDCRFGLAMVERRSNPQSTITIRNRQSPNPQSAVRNPQSTAS